MPLVFSFIFHYSLRRPFHNAAYCGKTPPDGLSTRPPIPQAKGRVERLWRTLQHRLVIEMRMAGISSVEQANAFLPGFILRYNAWFAVAPAQPDSTRPVAGELLTVCTRTT